jgi:hypothetical protein
VAEYNIRIEQTETGKKHEDLPVLRKLLVSCQLPVTALLCLSLLQLLLLLHLLQIRGRDRMLSCQLADQRGCLAMQHINQLNQLNDGALLRQHHLQSTMVNQRCHINLIPLTAVGLAGLLLQCSIYYESCIALC